jgi:hypothetical protein
MSTFRETILACITAEKNLWKIGDALLADISDEKELKQQLKAAVIELAKNGLSYTHTYLGIMRKTSKQFPANQRRNDVPFHIHRLACTVENLEVISDYAKQTNEQLTEKFVRALLGQMQEQEKKKRQQLKDEATAAKNKAKADKHAAIKILKNSTEQTVIDAAVLEKKRAEKDFKEAVEREKNIRIPPETRKLAVEALPSLVGKSGLMLAAEESNGQARRAERLLEKYVDTMPPEMIDGLLDSFVEVLELWQRNANVLRRRRYHPSNHLSAVR